MSSPTRSPDVEVRRSRRRRRTVSAYRDGERIVVLIPATMSKRDEATWVADMVARIERQERRKLRSDDDLVARAAKLNDTYLGGLAVPASVRWVTNQNARWGSCTPGDRTIRLSDRLQQMPAWVVDYVLVHELAHLLEAGHTPEFWAWVDRYPEGREGQGLPRGILERARGSSRRRASRTSCQPRSRATASPISRRMSG